MRDKPKGVGRMSGDAGVYLECEVITPITSLTKCAPLGKDKLELICLLGKVLTRDATRRHRFVVRSISRVRGKNTDDIRSHH